MSRLNSYRDMTEQAAKRLDDLARQGPKSLPEDVIESIAFSSAHVSCQVSDFEAGCATSRFLVAVMQQLYRAGYCAGRANTEAALGCGRDK